MSAEALAALGFEQLSQVGEGGFAKVFKAWQPTFHRWVAIKVLHLHDAYAGQQFARECQSMGSLSGHPSIVTIYDAGTLATGQGYLVMAYLAGGSLADRLEREGPLPWREACELAAGLADALQLAHERHIIHRDVKPENVLVPGPDQPISRTQLGDFGIARMDQVRRVTTGAGDVKGSMYHIAPELLDGGDPTPASDVYSLGSTLYELLAGRAAFERGGDDTVVAVVSRVLVETPPPLGDVAPPRIREAVSRSMTKAPADRFDSAAAMAAELRAALATPPPPPPGAPGRPSGRTTVVVPPLPAPGGPDVRTPSRAPSESRSAPSPPVPSSTVPSRPPSGRPERPAADQDRGQDRQDTGRRSRRRTLVSAGALVVVLLAVAVVLVARSGEDDPGGRARLASYDLSGERYVLAGPPAGGGAELQEALTALLAASLEAAGAEVDTVTAQRASARRSGLLAGEADLAWEPDLVVWTDVLGNPADLDDPGPVLDRLIAVDREDGITWLGPLRGEVGPSVLVLPDARDDAGDPLRSVPQLVDDLDAGTARLCAPGDDALLGGALEALRDRYALPEGAVLEVTRATVVQALVDGRCQGALALRADILLGQLAPAVLDDVDDVLPRVTMALAAASPAAPDELDALVGELAAALDDQALRDLQRPISAEGVTPRIAAERWLVADGFLPPT